MKNNLLIVQVRSKEILEKEGHILGIESVCQGGMEVFFQTDDNTLELKRLLSEKSFERVIVAFLDFLDTELPEVQMVRSLALGSSLVLYCPDLGFLKLRQHNASHSELVGWHEKGKALQLDTLRQADLVILDSSTDKEFLLARDAAITSVTREEVVSGGLKFHERARKKTSIVILTFNQLVDTRLCVESLIKNTDCDYELIFVDNGSTDDTKEYLEALKRTRNNVKTIYNSTNLGFAKANNQGVAIADGEYVLLLNNDVILTEGWLERLIACAESGPSVGVVGPCTNQAVGEQVIDIELAMNSEDIKKFACMQLLKNAGYWFCTHRIIGFCMLVKREVIDRIGMLDERFGPGGYEDYDYCLRVNQAGYKIMVASDVFVYHIGGQGYKKNNLDYDALRAQNIQIFIDKWCRKALEILERLPDGF